jgi:hypothetical protein
MSNQPRIALPKTIGQTLKYLDHDDLAALRAAVEEEWVRRGSGVAPLPVHATRGEASTGPAPGKAKPSASKLPVGKVSLIKASARSGMKRAAIARTLRLPLAEVNRVLNAERK